MLLYIVCMGLGVAWLFYAAVAIVRHGSAALRRPAFYAIPVAGAIAAALAVTEAPAELRYRLSKGSMDSTAQRVIRSPEDVSSIDRIGLWKVSHVEAFDGGMRFLISGAGFLDPIGYAYSPRREPPNIGGEDVYYHHDGPWWIWRESW